MSQDIVGANANGLLWWLYRATAEARCSPLKCSSFWPQQHSNLQPAGNVFFVCFVHPIRHKLTLKQKKRLNFWNLDFVLASLPSSCLFFKGLAEICMLCKHQQRGVKCNDELAPTEGQSWYYTPSPTHPQCPSVYKKQTGNKKIEEKKKKENPPPPNRAWQHATDFKCVRVHACVWGSACVRPWPPESLRIWEDWCMCLSVFVYACVCVRAEAPWGWGGLLVFLPRDKLLCFRIQDALPLQREGNRIKLLILSRTDKVSAAQSDTSDSPPLPPGCCGDRWPTGRWAAAAAAPPPGCWGRAKGWTNPGPPPPTSPGSSAPRIPAPTAPPLPARQWHRKGNDK